VIGGYVDLLLWGPRTFAPTAVPPLPVWLAGRLGDGRRCLDPGCGATRQALGVT
jgi:hypothetical protein